MNTKLWLLTLACSASLPAFSQTLQTVTTNGNTTTQPIIIDPGSAAFRSFSVRRDNAGLNTEIAVANNGTYGQLIWRPSLADVTQSSALNIGPNLLQYFNNGTLYNIWHAGRMGANSGLDADMVDGLHAASMFRYEVVSGSVDVLNYNYPAPGLYRVAQMLPTNGVPDNNYGVYFYLGKIANSSDPSQDWNGILAMGGNNGSLYTRKKTGTTWEPAWKKIWDAENFQPANYLALAGGTMTGSLTIGSTAAQKDLNVNGNIKSRKVKVTLTEWPDYVFEEQYPLMPLPELGAYIAQHKHLPDVPSAETVMQQGVDVGESQAVLLKKIEELTLYILDQHKRQEALEKRIAELEKKS